MPDTLHAEPSRRGALVWAESLLIVGGTAALAPSRRDDLASLGVRALLAATLATLMTGCVAGIFSGGDGVLLVTPAP